MCSVFDGLFCWWHAVGCLGQHECCSIDHPLISRTYLVGCCVWGGVLCENCIVDANAIKIATIIVLLLFVFSFLWFCSWYFLLSVREKCVCFLFLGAWWMPGYAKPMKDVIGCVKPRGVA